MRGDPDWAENSDRHFQT